MIRFVYTQPSLMFKLIFTLNIQLHGALFFALNTYGCNSKKKKDPKNHKVAGLCWHQPFMLDLRKPTIMMTQVKEEFVSEQLTREVSELRSGEYFETVSIDSVQLADKYLIAIKCNRYGGKQLVSKCTQKFIIR